MASSAGRKVLAVGKLVGAVAVAGLLVAGVMLPFAGGVGIAARNSVEAFEKHPCDVNDRTPAQRSVLLANDGRTAIAYFYSFNREIVPFAKIPTVVRQAAIAIEDHRFYEHHGVDMQSAIRAALKNSQSGDVVEGGSTLTMQYVKNLRLYQAKTKAEQAAAIAQNGTRKLADARCALTLENRLTKDQILARYLNIAYFGSGAYGIQTAAKSYFGVPASKLNLPQAALLAGIVRSPTRYDPRQSPKAAKARRNLVLDAMRSLGVITEAQAVKAQAARIDVRPAPRSAQGCANANGKIPNVGFFCDYAKAYLAAAGIPRDRLETGGLRIRTTIDANVQRRVQESLNIETWRGRKSVAVMDVLEPKTGKVRALGVSRRYGVNKKDPNQTSVALNIRPTAGAGSTYKLFTLISALKSKVPLRAFTIPVGDQYTSTICKNFTNEGIVPYQVKNAGTYGNGPWNLEDATYKSVNTFFVALLDQRFNCDLTGPVNTALELGLNSLRPKADDIKKGKQASFTLGPDDTSPLDLSAAYATVANGGVYCPPVPIESVRDASNRPIALPERRCERRLDEGIAHTVTQVLEKDTSASGGTALNAALPGGPVAGKTGTASSDPKYGSKNSAAWFVGYTADYLGTVAVFNPAASTTPLDDVPNAEGTNVFGRYSAGLWHDAMAPVLEGRSWSFPAEDPEVVNGNSIPVPSVVGQDVGNATNILRGAGFQVQVAPERKDGAPQDRVAEQSPQGRAAPGQTVYLYLGTGKGRADDPRDPRDPRPPGTPRPRPGRGGGGGGGG